MFELRIMDVLRTLRDTLDRAGLSEEEVRLYISALKKPDTVYGLSRRCGLRKDKGYKIFESLRDRSLLELDGRTVRSRGVYAFLEKLYTEGRKFYKIADRLREVQPFIKYLDERLFPGNIEVFSSSELAEHFLDLNYLNWNKIMSYGDFDGMFPALSVETDLTFIKRRLKNGRRAHIILSPGDYSERRLKPNDAREMRLTQILDPETARTFEGCLALMFDGEDKISLWERDFKTGIISGAMIHSPVAANFHKRTHRFLADMLSLNQKTV